MMSPRRAALCRIALPLLVTALGLLAWDAAIRASGTDLFPAPLQVADGVRELLRTGLLVKYAVASLFRVTIGFTLAALVGIPAGLALGWFRPLFWAFNPLIQVLRPISPIAWIPIAILWFGIDDRAPIFLIFLASVFPIAVSAIASVQSLEPVYIRAARNFGVTGVALVARLILPGTLPRLLTGMRLAIGVAWLVLVAAEMIAVDSGLGYLIIDARNAGKRYDLVVAGMAIIGAIGLALDAVVRQVEQRVAARGGCNG